MTRPTHTTPARLAATAAIAAAAVTLAVPAQAAQPNDLPANLLGSTFTVQNYFAAPAAPDGLTGLTPFFDAVVGRVLPGPETDGSYIYDIDIARNSIVMSWNTDPEWDAFEPYVGAIGGFSAEEASQASIADEYWFRFTRDLAGLTFTVAPDSALAANVRVEGRHTLVVSIPGGTEIGDGVDAVIQVARTR